jgi:NitT/TauT family transport system substrate-binding protein
MNGTRITTLATIQTSNMDLAIVARNDRGIASPGDLKGKKLGVTLGTNADFFADAFLFDHGIDREKVKIIDMKPDEMADALGAGRVDAVATFNPTLTLLKKNWATKEQYSSTSQSTPRTSALLACMAMQLNIPKL